MTQDTVPLVPEEAEGFDAARIRRALDLVLFTEVSVRRDAEHEPYAFGVSPKARLPHTRVEICFDVAGSGPDALAVAKAPLLLARRLLDVIDRLEGRGVSR